MSKVASAAASDAIIADKYIVRAIDVRPMVFRASGFEPSLIRPRPAAEIENACTLQRHRRIGDVVRLHDGDLLHRHAGGSVASARSQSESKPRSICTSAR